MTTKIEWTDETWNPVRGCAIVSKGCTNCYAMRQAHRFSAAGLPYKGLTKRTKGGPVWTGKVTTHPELLDRPLRWRTPRRIFANSMSDLFHEDVPDEFILQVFDVMRQSENGFSGRLVRHVATHTYQILTKRPSRMLDFCRRLRFGQNDGRGMYLAQYSDHNGFNPMAALKHVWLGVSVEDQAAADERIPLLLQTPAAVRWISAEPLLGPVKFRWDRWLPVSGYEQIERQGIRPLDWVVAGGESGPGARPMHPDWARDLRFQCAAFEIPFFFKQWGDWAPIQYLDQKTDRPLINLTPRKGVEVLLGGPSEGTTPCNMKRLGKAKAGRHLDGRTHDEYPA